MSKQDNTTARGTVRRGFFVSSASGAAASKPMNARKPYTDAATTPPSPSNPGTVACAGVNSDRLLASPAAMIIHTDITTSTAISNRPEYEPESDTDLDAEVVRQERPQPDTSTPRSSTPR